MATKAKREQWAAMLNAARTAYSAMPTTPSPYIPTSDMDCAWRIGQWLASIGAPPPTEVRPSRPWTYHVSGRKVRVPWARANSPAFITD